MSEQLDKAFYDFQLLTFQLKDTVCFAVSADWWNTSYLLFTLKAECSDLVFAMPEKIDNSCILSLKTTENNNNNENLDNIKGYKLKETLKYCEDYIFVNESVWNWVFKHFGGGFLD